MSKNLSGLRVLKTGFEAQSNFGWKHGDVGSVVRGYFNGEPREVKNITLDWVSSRDALLVVLYRDVFSWLQSLHLTPHHAHEFYDLDFTEFIRKPWRAFYSEPGSENISDDKERLKWAKQKYLWESYPSVIAMRQTKINVFESFKYRFQNVAYLNYEALLEDPERCVRALAERYGIDANQNFAGVDTYKGGSAPFTRKAYDPLTPDDILYLLRNIDWDAESQVGYHVKPGASVLARSKKARQSPGILLKFTPRHHCYVGGALVTLRPVPSTLL